MNYFNCKTLFLPLLLIIASSLNAQQSPVAAGGDAKAQTFINAISGNNAFAFELFKKLYSNSENVFFSPYSIRSALAMTYAGAEKETKNQMSKVLHFDLNNITTAQEFLDFNNGIKDFNNDNNLKISIANALWKKDDYPFKKDYLELTKKYYDASIFPLPSKAKPINDWVSEKTMGRIPTVITDNDITELTRLILTNTIYFKGEWLAGFEPHSTIKTKFTTLARNTIDVDMMFQKSYFNYYEDTKIQAIELPYKGRTMMMTIILPNANNSLSSVTEELKANFLLHLHSGRQFSKVELYLPKFTFKSKFELNKVFENMGMPNAFNFNADFSGISDGQKLEIDKVIHKAIISVDENGSEAAAATLVEIALGACMGCKEPPRIVFRADRPFMILISENSTGNILFMGNVNNPNQQ